VGLLNRQVDENKINIKLNKNAIDKLKLDMASVGSTVVATDGSKTPVAGVSKELVELMDEQLKEDLESKLKDLQNSFDKKFA
jgi:hypothetical protein